MGPKSREAAGVRGLRLFMVSWREGEILQLMGCRAPEREGVGLVTSSV